MNKIISFLYFIGALMVLVGSSVYITQWSYAPYIYTVGAGFFALAQINSPYRGTNKNIKRLRHQQIIGAICLVLTGLFMFTTRNNEWIASLTIAAFLEIYTVFRISQEEKKEKSF
jgi:predicted metal-binding membrane protein